MSLVKPARLLPPHRPHAPVSESLGCRINRPGRTREHASGSSPQWPCCPGLPQPEAAGAAPLEARRASAGARRLPPASARIRLSSSVGQKTQRSREDSEKTRRGLAPGTRAAQSGLRQGWPNRPGARAGTPRKPQNRADCEMQQNTAKRSSKLACHAVEPAESGFSSGKRMFTCGGAGPTRPRKTRITGGHGRSRCSHGAVAIGHRDECRI